MVSEKKNCQHRTFAGYSAHFEVATTTTKKNLGGGSGEFITVGGVRLELPARRCITDPRRSRRQLYTRLETWLSRFLWEAFRAGRVLESQRIAAEVYYIRHLRRHHGASPHRWDLGHQLWIEEFVRINYPAR